MTEQFFDERTRTMPEQTHFFLWRTRYWIALLVVALLGAGAYVFFTKSGEAQAPRAQQGIGAGAARPIPVVAAKAKTGEINVYLTGLGTVTPLNTVTVKSRVDGQLMKVLFHEGDIVTAGGPLPQLNPPPPLIPLTQP